MTLNEKIEEVNEKLIDMKNEYPEYMVQDGLKEMAIFGMELAERKGAYLSRVMAHGTDNPDQVLKEAIEKFDRENGII